MKKILLFLLLLMYPLSSFAYHSKTYDFKEIDRQAKYVANLIRDYVEARPLTVRYPLYSEIRTIMSEKISEIPSSNPAKRQLYKDIAFYHNNNIVELVYYISSRPGAVERFTYWEKDEISNLQTDIQSLRNTLNIDSSIRVITQRNEFTDGSDIYKMNLGTSKKIDVSEIKEHKNLPGIIVYQEGKGYLYSIFSSDEKKIPFTEILAQGGKKMLLYNDSYFIEDGDLLTYQYDDFFPVESYYGIYESDLEANGYSYDDAVILRLQDAKNNITFSPKILKIANADDIDTSNEFGHELVNISIRDVLLTKKDYSKELKEIHDLAIEITQGLESEDDKILAIYDWVNKNITYPKDYDTNNINLGSGIESYLSGKGLCVGQSRLMFYMLKAAKVKNVKIIAGYVVDSFDFPKVGHAWIQIGDYFYDPSFEREYQEDSEKYLYYKIPYDIIYTNRYNLKDLPKKLLDTDKQEIKTSVEKRRSLLLEKYYPGSKYMLLQRSYFVKKYGLQVEDEITLSDIIEHAERQRIDFKNGNLAKIYDIFDDKINYFKIASLDTSLEDILQNIDYDISNQIVIEIYRDGELSSYGLAEM